MKSKIIFCLALVLNGSFTIVRADEAVTNSAGNTIIGWTNVAVKLVVPGSSGFLGFHSTKCKIEDVPAKEIFYTTKLSTLTETNSLLAIHDPYTKKISVVPPTSSESPMFYISYDSGLLWCWFAFGGQFVWSKSYLEVPENAMDGDATIARFVSGFNDAVEFQDSRADLRGATPFNFFTEGSDMGYGGVIQKLEVTDKILHLDYLENGGKGGKYTGDVDGSDDKSRYHYWESRPPHYGALASFWINLKTKKVIKSVVDGHSMYLYDGQDSAVANPFISPINIGTLRWGIVPALAAMMTAMGTFSIARKARSKFHHVLSKIVLAILAWSLIMLYRAYFLDAFHGEMPDYLLNWDFIHDYWLLPNHIPQIVIGVAVAIVAIQALLLRFSNQKKTN